MNDLVGRRRGPRPILVAIIIDIHEELNWFGPLDLFLLFCPYCCLRFRFRGLSVSSRSSRSRRRKATIVDVLVIFADIA